MNAAAVRGTMTQRCLVERDGAGNDAEGNPAAPAWATHVASQPCRFWYGQSEREQLDGNTQVVVEDARMLLPKSADVTEADRINGVTDRLGATVHSGVLNIRALVNRGTHLELVLQGAA